MSWIFWILLLGIALNTLRLRLRARGLHVLDDAGTLPDPSTDHRFLIAHGVWLPESARRAASDHARRYELRVLDLVPEDLPVPHALFLARSVHPGSYRDNPLAFGAGAGQAILVHRDVLERSGLQAGEALTADEMARATTRLKRHASRSTDVAVVRGLRASERDAGLRFWWRFLDVAAAPILGLQLAEYLLFAVGLILEPALTLAALAGFQVQPWLVFWGGPLKPRDLLRQPLVRIFRALSDWTSGVRDQISLLRGSDAETRAKVEHEASLRREYQEVLGRGVERLFDPRRPDCPICHSEQLEVAVEVGDLYHHKPGEFRLERCRDCAHVFQNPRLSFEGLDFYYRDFYDGQWAAILELIFAAGAESYRARARMLEGHAKPRRWLDVGTGHGHFCLVAREIWPEARFEGLDMGESVEEAYRRRWIDGVYRDLFPDVAPKIEGQYDVVSMHHYLEHTVDPLRELDAAAIALEPGGHLLIELPDPESPYGRLLGRRWVAWFQPQHLHFLSIANLEKALRARGLEPVARERGSAHIPIDLTFFAYTFVDQLAPLVGMPWQPPASIAAHVWRWTALVACVPIFALAFVTDELLGIALRSREEPGSNTFRLLARKRAGEPAADSSQDG